MTACDFELLSRYLDGELPLPARARLELHLKDCPPCRSELDDLRHLESVLAAWGTRQMPLPVKVESRMANSLDRRRGLRRVSALGRMMPAALGSGIAAVLVLLSANFSMLYSVRTDSSFRGTPQAEKLIQKQSAPLIRARRSSAILGMKATSRLAPRSHQQIDMQ